MLPIPDLSGPDIVFGNIAHMPRYEDVPDEFKRSGNKYCQFISDWFFNGAKIEKLKPKDGVNQDKALKAIKAILWSWEPKHEHKEAGCAYLLSQWFDIK